MLTLRLNSSSGVPPYLQIAQQIRQALAAGILVPGDQLPTVKDVVTQLAVNPNTVFKSYRELEHEGLVQGRPGAGTFVLKRPDGPPPGVHVKLSASLSKWVRGARAEGLDDTAIEALMRAVLDADETQAIA
jgi:GntR family transcriptional regulator